MMTCISTLILNKDKKRTCNYICYDNDTAIQQAEYVKVNKRQVNSDEEANWENDTWVIQKLKDSMSMME